MSREIFHDLLEKYEKGLCTKAEKQIVEQWYGLLDRQETTLPAEELSSLEQKLWDKINLQIGEGAPVRQFTSHKVDRNLKRVLALAAVFFAAIILLVLFRQPVQDHNATFLAQNVHVLQKIYNGGSTSKIIILEDGSQVTLEPKAGLTFPLHFKAAVREVSLDGNAFFLISKNPKRPFLVYNKHIVTRVLGTSFSIRLNPNTNQTEVTVKTGKVLVTPNRAGAALPVPQLFTKSREVTLIPNEKTIYDMSAEGFKTTLADNPVPILKLHGSQLSLPSKFNDTPVKDVVSSLTDTYGIEIILKTDDLKEITFTGDLSSLNLYNKLDFLCQSIDAHYHLDGTRIIIAKK